MPEKPTYEELEKKNQSLEKIISDRHIVKEKFNKQTQCYRLLMDISAECINIPIDTIENAIQTSLNKIGKFVDADRAYIFKYDFKNNIGINTYEWCGRGVEPQIQNLQKSPIDAFSDWIKSHRNGQPVIINKVTELQKSLKKDILEQQKIVSLLSVPIFYDYMLMGFSGFDFVKKHHQSTMDEIEIIQIFNKIIMNLHKRMDQEQEREKSKEMLHESEQRFRSLFEEAPDAIFIITMDDHIIAANTAASKMLGYTRDEFQNMTVADLQAPEIRGKVGSIIQNELTRDKFFEGLDIHKDGTMIPIEIHNHTTLINGQEVILSVVRDISERKQSDKEKIENQKIMAEHEKLALVGRIAGKMAHDFNNILGIVMGNAELALLDCNEPEIRKTLELIFAQTMRGRNLTKNLVAFAKDQEPKQQYFSINEKIGLVLTLLKKDLEKVNAIREDGTGVPDLIADPGMIEHALVNLVQNSIHATSLVEQPRIIIRTSLQDKNICIEIEDNGCGIPKQHLKKIYEPAFTLKGSRDITGSYKPGIKGTGYGMANVKKYIEQHKGDILIDSKIGQGTKITISLPVIKKELTNKEIIELQKEKSYCEKYILLVEDEQAISDVQYRILTNEPCNHKVDIAANGQMAMDLFDRNEYECISLDFVLPGKFNGMDVYQHIRQTNAAIPILFISGNLDFLESIKELKQKDPYVDHVSKPCQNKDYISSINILLGGLGR